MTDRQLALKSKIDELMELLATILACRIESVSVPIDNGEERLYSVDGIRDALATLAAEIISSPETSIAAIETKYEHDRADVFRIIRRLAQIVAATATGNEYGAVTKHVSTF